MNDMAKPLGVALIGTGFGQKIHLPALQIHPRTQPVAIYNPDPDKARSVADGHDIPIASSDLAEILARPEVDAVSIATPPATHYDMARQAIAAGKHLLLEKPLNLRASATRELYHLAAERGVVAAADFEFRFVPAWQLLAEYLQQGFAGKLRLVKIDWLVASRANPERAWNWYARKDLGGGVLGAVGSHSFDYLHWLFGGVRRLSARLSTAVAERPDPKDDNRLKPVDADDTALLMLELADGTPCQLTLSSVTYGGRGHWLEIYGDRGTLILGSSNLKDYVHGFDLRVAAAGEALQPAVVPERLAFVRVYDDGRLAPVLRVVDRWVQSIDSGKPMIPSLKEGVYSQLLMDLTHRSHACDGWAEVPDLEAYLKGAS